MNAKQLISKRMDEVSRESSSDKISRILSSNGLTGIKFQEVFTTGREGFEFSPVKTPYGEFGFEQFGKKDLLIVANNVKIKSNQSEDVARLLHRLEAARKDIRDSVLIFRGDITTQYR
tara:strand:+ start:231 stop:584 length:354 start_codon:yes stop_codon:yes gene_type:complete